MMVSPLTISINASTYVPVELPDKTYQMDVLIYTEDNSEFYIATDINGSDAAPVPIGSLSIPRVNSGEILCYVKGTRSINLYVLFGRI
jgi:hypothetical protein